MGIPIEISDNTWDAIVSLHEPARTEALELLFAVVDRNEDVLSKPRNEWGRYCVLLTGACFLEMEPFSDPERMRVYPPICYEDPVEDF